MKNLIKTSLYRSSVAAGALITSGLLSATAARAADPYDKNLENRVEALEKELNIMEGDSKGKNVESTDVPTYVRASSNVSQLTFSGELRLRYEYDNTQSQTASSHTQTSRERYRLRLAADYKLNDNFFAGIATSNASAADSGNTTLTEGFDNYSIYLWRFFVGWHSKDDNYKLIVGKQPNPFYQETEMLWDADISPVGVTEQVTFPVSPQLSLGIIGGQFAYYNNAANSPYNPATVSTSAAGATVTTPAVAGGVSNQDAFLFYQQAMATFKATNDLTVTGAGGFFFYPGHGGVNAPLGNGAAGSGNSAAPSTGTAPTGALLQSAAAFNSANAERNLAIGTFDTDVKVGLGKMKLKVYGQADYNFKGGARDSQEYGQPALDGTLDKISFAGGLTIGSNYKIEKKGDYLVLAEYRSVGLGSVDPNLNDSDFNLSHLGFRGVKVAASYGFYPWMIGTVTFFSSTNLGGEKNVTFPLANYNASQVLFVDMLTKF